MEVKHVDLPQEMQRAMAKQAEAERERRAKVINAEGEWEEVVSNIGFPSGKNKTVVVDLEGKFLSSSRKVRIRTNMEIYWDYIFFANDENVNIKMTNMAPESADYHYRGFSAKSRMALTQS